MQEIAMNDNGNTSNKNMQAFGEAKHGKVQQLRRE